MIWAAGTMVLIYIVLRYFKLHRVSLSDEKIGKPFKCYYYFEGRLEKFRFVQGWMKSLTNNPPIDLKMFWNVRMTMRLVT